MSDETHTQPGHGGRGTSGDDAGGALALMVAWSRSAPGRVGEVALVPRDARGLVIGRGGPRPEDGAPRLLFGPRRGGRPAPFEAPVLSRSQLKVDATEDGVRIVRIGKAALEAGGIELDEHELGDGETLVVGGELALMCTRVAQGALGGGATPSFAPGAPDAYGIVGESTRIWALRDEVSFYAEREAHVLIQGPSGAGKELCARAIHAASSRRSGPFIARNAATLPAGIIDAELFGNARNYPNAGMRERAGIVGEADGGTLFLDELGELPEAQQSHLLRVLDDGEYHRLGEDRARRADVRLLAATNRPTASMKHDLLARFRLRLSVPGLNERREDIPLVIRHLLHALASRDAGVKARFFEGGEPRVDPAFVCALAAHDYTTHVRELESLLLGSMATSRDGWLALTAATSERLAPPASAAAAASGELGREQIEAALKKAQGNISVAWKLLGLSSRDALNRLIKKHGVVVRRP